MLIFKYGFWPSLLLVILILMIISIAAAAAGRWQFNKQIDSELNKLKAENKLNQKNNSISKNELSDLPDPVKNWLQKSGIVGKKPIKAVEIKQSGSPKMAAD